MVLSLSKLSVWFTFGLTGYVVASGCGMTEIGAALVANIGALAQYAYRRKLQARHGLGSFTPIPFESMPTTPETEPFP